MLILLAMLATAAEEPARVYVYARRDTVARSWLRVACDNRAAAEVKRGIFFAVNVEPGKHMISSDNTVPLSVKIAAGESGFVRLDWDYGIGRPPIAVFTRVDAAEALREMKYLSYVSARRIHSNLVPQTDPRKEVQPQLRTR